MLGRRERGRLFNATCVSVDLPWASRFVKSPPPSVHPAQQRGGRYQRGNRGAADNEQEELGRGRKGKADEVIDRPRLADLRICRLILVKQLRLYFYQRVALRAR